MGETITTLMPLPEDEESWGDLFVMFATATGAVRRNRLSDFTNVMANGKIAMKLKENDRLVRVRTCTLDDDVLLTTRNGKCIRFPLTDVRLFVGRASVGVRGIRLASGDEVIGMSALKHVAAEVAEREAYLQSVGARRRLVGSDYTGKAEEKANHEKLAARLDEPAFIGMEAEEEFILTISEDGFGKRSSAYEYRVSKRGGKGIASMDLKRADGANSAVVVSFPIIDTDQLVMVSDNGQLIRVPVKDISFVGRTTKGVTLFKMASGEHVVSVTRIRDLDEGTENEDEAGDDGQQATNAAGEGEG
jgi:DNA gyrase subunit A